MTNPAVEKMKEFKPFELVWVGSGGKMHITKLSVYYTFCGVGGEMSPVITDAVSFTEKCPELCQNCLRIYRSLRKGDTRA